VPCAVQTDCAFTGNETIIIIIIIIIIMIMMIMMSADYKPY